METRRCREKQGTVSTEEVQVTSEEEEVELNAGERERTKVSIRSRTETGKFWRLPTEAGTWTAADLLVPAGIWDETSAIAAAGTDE